MKRKSLAYPHWNCKKTFYGIQVKEDWLVGYLSMFEIQEVEEPLFWNFQGERICICDKNLTWLTILPQKEFLCMTALLDASGEPVLWYIDMIAGKGLDPDGIPYFDDLYLDLVLFPDGRIMEDDRDELEEARSEGDITEEQYHLALQTCERLKQNLSGRETEVRRYTKRCYDWLQKQRRAKASIEGSGSFC